MSLVDHPKLASSSPADDESNSWVIDLGNNDELTEKSREAANVAADCKSRCDIINNVFFTKCICI